MSIIGFHAILVGAFERQVKRSGSADVNPAAQPQRVWCPRLQCARRPETWRGRGQSESLPRTPCHIGCRRRRVVSSAGRRGARRGAVWARPRERSGCLGPAPKGGPTDTEHTWGIQGSHLGSECHQASPLPVVVVVVVLCGCPAEILETEYRLFQSYIKQKERGKKSRWMHPDMFCHHNKPFCWSILAMSFLGTAAYSSLLHVWTNGWKQWLEAELKEDFSLIRKCLEDKNSVHCRCFWQQQQQPFN